MQIPHEVSARPDTGLYNAKLGIWLFLASEVMLFGGLFSEYIFMRIGADPGYWPRGLLNVPVGTLNTIILIASSVTVVLAWASLKMRRYTQYWWYMLITILCGVIFLGVKLGYEWPDKFNHFGVYIKKSAAEKYEDYLGNHHLAAEDKEPRYEISGHLHSMVIERNGQREHIVSAGASHGAEHAAPEGEHAAPAGEHAEPPAKMTEVPHLTPSVAWDLVHENGVKLISYELQLDKVNAFPTDKANDLPQFFPRERSDKEATIKAEDIDSASAFYPRHNTYFGTYFLITGLHGLHVLGGVLVFSYMFLFGRKLYLRNPEHLANRIEVAGLFWHFVDLVWIFVFPIFYLL